MADTTIIVSSSAILQLLLMRN